MATTGTSSSRSYTTPCDNPQQPCPDCGGLECLCRPRFFAGQLLTDGDLNRLNHYIIEKNKLHNRYLYGWGVVCGLEVVCDPCSGVTVNPGYALSPCGEDVIVCQKQSVDVCSLINACKKPKNNCNPIDVVNAYDCANLTETWVLAIRYQEKPTRGVTSLKGASGSSCCSKCSCGGSSSCGCGGSQSSSTKSSTSSGGCGCGGSATSSTASSSSTSTASTPAQCEPTAICEGYTFEVCKLPASAGTQAPISPLVDRMRCCLTLLFSSLPAISNKPTQQQIQNWCCLLRENLADLFATYPGHACQLTKSLGTLCRDAANASPADIAMAAAVYVGQFFVDCFCSALLPPCPAPVSDDRIFLASITVNCKDCSIIQICNWDVRKFAVGFPMLSYWLSPLQYGAQIKAAIASFCCKPLVVNTKIAALDQNEAVNFQTAQYPMTADQRSAVLTRVIAESYTQPVGADTIALASLGAVDPKQQPLLTADQMQMPIETFLMSQIVQPLLAGVGTLLGTGRAVTEPLHRRPAKYRVFARRWPRCRAPLTSTLKPSPI